MKLIVWLSVSTLSLSGVFLSPNEAQAGWRFCGSPWAPPPFPYGFPCPQPVPRIITVCETDVYGNRVCRNIVVFDPPGYGSTGSLDSSQQILAALNTLQETLKINADLADGIRRALDNRSDDSSERGLRQQLLDLVNAIKKNDEASRKALEKQVAELAEEIKRLKEKGKDK